MDNEPQSGTREHLLDVAEILFAQQGYSETSIRQLAAETGANQGAVNYHFDSKENLYRAVLKRRFDHVHVQRVSRLGTLRAQAGGSPLAVRDILDCLIGPAFETALTTPHFPKLLARNIFTPPPFSADVMQESLAEMFELFGRELSRSLPSLSFQQIGLRMQMTGGALLFLANVNPSHAGIETGDRCENYTAVLDYVTGGFLARNRTPLRMINIAFIMLFGDRAKYLMLISGIGFATVLMVQGMALFCGLLSFSFANLTNIRSPIWVADPIIEQVGDSQPLRDTDISRVRSVSGVGWAAPLYIGNTQARLPEVGVTKQVTLIGLDATTFMGAPTEIIAGSLEDLRQPDSVIVDERSLTLLTADKSKPLALGDTFEMNDRTARVVGICKAAAALGPGSFVFTTYDRAVQYAPSQRKTLSFVLVRPQEGSDAAEVAAAITKETGLHARTEKAFRDSTVRWTLFNSPIPFVVGIIVAIGFLVGVVISGQVFYSFVLENSRYLGAFRAMGAETATLTRMILVQAATVGIVGYALGIGLISFVISLLPGGKVPLLLLWPVPIISFVAILFICTLAAGVGIHRIAKLEPAVVFRG